MASRPDMVTAVDKAAVAAALAKQQAAVQSVIDLNNAREILRNEPERAVFHGNTFAGWAPVFIKDFDAPTKGITYAGKTFQYHVALNFTNSIPGLITAGGDVWPVIGSFVTAHLDENVSARAPQPPAGTLKLSTLPILDDISTRGGRPATTADWSEIMAQAVTNGDKIVQALFSMREFMHKNNRYSVEMLQAIKEYNALAPMLIDYRKRKFVELERVGYKGASFFFGGPTRNPGASFPGWWAPGMYPWWFIFLPDVYLVGLMWPIRAWSHLTTFDGTGMITCGEIPYMQMGMNFMKGSPDTVLFQVMYPQEFMGMLVQVRAQLHAAKIAKAKAARMQMYSAVAAVVTCVAGVALAAAAAAAAASATASGASGGAGILGTVVGTSPQMSMLKSVLQVIADKGVGLIKEKGQKGAAEAMIKEAAGMVSKGDPEFASMAEQIAWQAINEMKAATATAAKGTADAGDYGVVEGLLPGINAQGELEKGTAGQAEASSKGSNTLLWLLLGIGAAGVGWYYWKRSRKNA